MLARVFFLLSFFIFALDLEITAICADLSFLKRWRKCMGFVIDCNRFFLDPLV